MRKWSYETVASSPGVSEAFASRIYGPGAVEGAEPGDSPTRPFIVIRFSTRDSALGGVKQQRIQVWLHDDNSSMLPMDSIANGLEKWLPDNAPAWHDGDWIMDCVWEDTSGDGFDDHYQTQTRYVTFLITYRPAP